MSKPKAYLSPSNQNRNAYAFGNTTEDVQCQKIAEAARIALERSGVEVMVASPNENMATRCRASDSFGADVHAPIHTNAFNGKVAGTRLFCHSMTGKGYKVCKAVFKYLAPLTPGTSENIQVNTALYEVRTPKAPTVYIEAEFHDVPSGAKWIIENTTAIGEAIAKGICEYLGVAFADKPAAAPAAPKEENNSGKLYRVQVGAYAVRANAEAMLAKIKAAGFKDAFIKEV